jgi:hypothetical protein
MPGRAGRVCGVGFARFKKIIRHLPALKAPAYSSPGRRPGFQNQPIVWRPEGAQDPSALSGRIILHRALYSGRCPGLASSAPLAGGWPGLSTLPCTSNRAQVYYHIYIYTKSYKAGLWAPRPSKAEGRGTLKCKIKGRATRPYREAPLVGSSSRAGKPDRHLKRFFENIERFTLPLSSRLSIGSTFFSWPSPEFPIGSRSCSLSDASRFATSMSKRGCHPAARPDEALQNRRQIKVRVQFWKVDTEPRRADLNLLQLRGCSLFQPLSIAW